MKTWMLQKETYMKSDYMVCFTLEQNEKVTPSHMKGKRELPTVADCFMALIPHLSQNLLHNHVILQLLPQTGKV